MKVENERRLDEQIWAAAHKLMEFCEGSDEEEKLRAIFNCNGLHEERQVRAMILLTGAAMLMNEDQLEHFIEGARLAWNVAQDDA